MITHNGSNPCSNHGRGVSPTGMRKRKTKNIDVSQRQGKPALKKLIDLTREKTPKKKNPIIAELEERGVFD